MIQEIGRKECKLIRKAAIEALNMDVVLKSLGIEAKAVSGGSFDDVGFSLKIQFSVAGAESREAQDWKRYSDLVDGFEADDLGREIQIRSKGGNDRYTIVGYLPKRRKFPVMCKSVTTGKISLFTEDGIVKALAASRS